MCAARFWVAEWIYVQTLGLGLGLDKTRSEGTGRLQKRREGALAQLWLGLGLHAGTTA